MLSKEETNSAMKSLYVEDFVQKFPKRDLTCNKNLQDPLYENQVYSLHSFVPVKGATPDKNGVFGFVKFRGTFPTREAANERAEWLVREVDSYSQIYTSYVGKPFPLAQDTKKFVQETKDVNLRKDMEKTMSEAVKEKRAEERKDVQEIKEREQRLLREQDEDYKENPLEKYTTLRVKKANLVWSFDEARKKLREMKELIKKAQREIEEMEKEDPSYQSDYFAQYEQARKFAGIPDDQLKEGFIRFMVEDLKYDFDTI